MKPSLPFVILGAALASAQGYDTGEIQQLVGTLPSCSLPCLLNGITSACGNDPSSISDYQCQCDNQQAIAMDAQGCVLDNCSQDEALMTLNVTNEICDIVNGGSASGGGGGGAPAPEPEESSSMPAPTTPAASSSAPAASSSAPAMSSSAPAMSSSAPAATTPEASLTLSPTQALPTEYTGAAGPAATAGAVGLGLAAAVVGMAL